MGDKWLHLSCDFVVSLTTLHDISEFIFDRTLKASHYMYHAVLVLWCVGKWEILLNGNLAASRRSKKCRK